MPGGLLCTHSLSAFLISGSIKLKDQYQTRECQNLHTFAHDCINMHVSLGSLETRIPVQMVYVGEEWYAENLAGD